MATFCDEGLTISLKPNALFLADSQNWRHLLAETGWVAFGQCVAMLGGLVATKLLTNMLPPNAYGEYSLALSVAAMIGLFLYGPLAQIAIRYFSICEERNQRSLFSQTLGYFCIVVTMVLSTIGFVISISGNSTNASGWTLILAAAIAAGSATGLHGILVSILTAARERRITAILQAYEAWARGLGSVALVLVIAHTGQWVVIGYAAGSFSAVILGLRILSNRGFNFFRFDFKNRELQTSLKKDFISYGTPFLGFATFACLSQYSDRWILQYLFGPDSVGIYAVLSQTANLPALLLSSFLSQLFAPVVFSAAGQLENHVNITRARRVVIKSSLMYVFVIGVSSMTLLFLGDWPMRLVSNSRYAGYGNELLIAYVSASIFMLGQFMALLGLARRRHATFLLPKLVHAIVSVVLGVLFASAWGILGIVCANLIANLVHLVLIGRASFQD